MEIVAKQRAGPSQLGKRDGPRHPPASHEELTGEQTESERGDRAIVRGRGRNRRWQQVRQDAEGLRTEW